MNWFGFAPGREGLLVDTGPNEIVIADGSDQPTDRDLPLRPAVRGTADVAPSGVAVLLSALAGIGAVPSGLAPRLEEALREVASRHPGILQVVDAVTTGGPAGAAVVLVVERRAAPEITAEEVAHRFGLTRRQGAVALLLARRHSNAEIARLLAVSPHTARHHTERVLEKLGVTSRMQVAALVFGQQ